LVWRVGAWPSAAVAAANLADKERVDKSHTAVNAILTPRETRATSRQRIPLFIHISVPQQIEKRKRRKVARRLPPGTVTGVGSAPPGPFTATAHQTALEEMARHLPVQGGGLRELVER